MGRRRQRKSQRDGCAPLLLSCLVTCLFLSANSALLTQGLGAIRPIAPPLLLHPKVAQLIMFVGPVVLLFPEWWMIDGIVNRMTTSRSKRKRSTARGSG